MKNNDAPSPAWLPLTYHGVARFAGSGLKNLWIAQSVGAVLTSAAALVFLYVAWMPVLERGIRQLPLEGEIRGGALVVPFEGPRRLAQNRFLDLWVNPHGIRLRGLSSDVRLEWVAKGLECHSLLGYWKIPYPPASGFALNRRELEPWWGAWKPAVYAGLFAAVAAFCLVVWSLLGLLYAAPVKFLASLKGVPLNVAEAWKLASAALMPGALLLVGAILLYAVEAIHWVEFLGAAALHLAAGWTYCAGAAVFIPKSAPNLRANQKNPFKSKGASKRGNPFTRRQEGKNKRKLK